MMDNNAPAISTEYLLIVGGLPPCDPGQRLAVHI
jgi:hypothetical protein